MNRCQGPAGVFTGSMKVLNEAHDHFTSPEVEASGGFIGEQNTWVTDECAGQNDPLLLSARQFARAMRGAAPQSNFIQPRYRYGLGFIFRLTPYQQRHHHIFERRKLGEQTVNLPDKAQLAVAELSEAVRRKLTYVILPEVYRTASRPVQTAEKMKKRAFAGAGFANESKLFAALDVEVEAAEDDQVSIA